MKHYIMPSMARTTDFPSRLLAWLTQLAEAGHPTPTNDEICGRFGYKDESTIKRTLAALERKGLLKRVPVGRVFEIPATGQRTAPVITRRAA